MDTNKTIQLLYKIARIASKIIFILCIVGFCICVAGIAAMAIGAGAVKLDGVALPDLMERSAGLSMAAIYAAAAVGAVTCAVHAVLSKLTEIYCKNELADGEPFTLRGAKELMRLGVLTIALPLAATILCAIGVGIAEHFFPGAKDAARGNYTSVGLGLGMILLSLFCRYGAERMPDEPS